MEPIVTGSYRLTSPRTRESVALVAPAAATRRDVSMARSRTSLRRAQATTRASDRANCSTAARPQPIAPVTTATLPFDSELQGVDGAKRIAGRPPYARPGAE